MTLTARAHAFVREHVHEGAIVIDATAGNGHDTLFLADLVGDMGKVYALDIQSEAIASTANRLPTGLRKRVELLQADHANLEQLIPDREQGCIQVAMFNLGYLPGGEKSKITQIESTAPALTSAWAMLAQGAVLSVLAYPGHAGGATEATWVQQFFRRLSDGGTRTLTERGSGDMTRCPVLHLAFKE